MTTSMDWQVQAKRWGASALPLALGGLGLWRCWAFTVDDGFVMLRYAHNLAAGNGLVFNLGERVEGHSNTLWVLWLALGETFGVPLLGWAKLSGAVMLLALLWLVSWLAKRLTAVWYEDAPAPWLAPMLAAGALALHPGAAYYATSAMGTLLTMLLATAAAGLSALDMTSEEGRAPRLRRLGGIALALLCLTRPEAPLWWLTISVTRLWHWRKATTARKREMVRAGLTLLPWLGLSTFRLWYYGSLLPNTYAAKPSTLLSYPKGAWRHLIESAGSLGWALALALALAVLSLLRRAFAEPKRRPLLLALLGPVLAQLAFTLYSGGDWMPHGRFLLIALPLLLLLGALALASAPDNQLLAAAAAVAIVLQGWGAHSFWHELAGNSEHDHALRSDNNVAMARWLADHLKPGQSIVTDEIGAIGYYSGLRVHDMWGLIDPQVAAILHDSGFNPYNSPLGDSRRQHVLDTIATTLLSRHPDFVLIDYRAPVPSPGQPYDRRYFLPYTMSGMSVNMDERYQLMHGFELMTNPPKTFLLFARAEPREAHNNSSGGAQHPIHMIPGGQCPPGGAQQVAHRSGEHAPRSF